MTEQEIAARLIVLETLCMGTIGILFSVTRQVDPKHERALKTLDDIRATMLERLRATGDPKTLNEGKAYLDELLSGISGSLHLLRRPPDAA